MIVAVDDFNGDLTPGLLFQGTVADQGLMLRKGKPSGRDVDRDSSVTSASSLTGGWLKADKPFIIGIPYVKQVAAGSYSRTRADTGAGNPVHGAALCKGRGPCAGEGKSAARKSEPTC